MLLFQKRFHAGLLDGSIRLTFRRWQKPHVRPGGRYRCHPIGVLEVEQVDRVPVAAIGEAEARAAGFSSRDELLRFLTEGPGGPMTPQTKVWRIALHHGGDGDRVEIALDDRLTPDDAGALARRLERLGAWALPTLRLIGRRPRVAASVLARSLGRERDPFKIDVRKLKRLGLTQSFEVGYELSPRGRALLAQLPRRRPAVPTHEGPPSSRSSRANRPSRRSR
ncbi:MAG TPA: ASCH domain-containing protein [Myxococcaceae bacterium]|nr:ASCH domain-containing protein [Myxococcaceae bacterium]